MAKIWFFKFPLVNTLGGAEFHTLKLAQALVSAGHKTKLVSSDLKLLELFSKNNLPHQYLFAGWEPTSRGALLLWPLSFLIAKLKFKKLFREIPPGSVLFMQSLIEKFVFTPLAQKVRKVIWLEHKIPGRWLKLNPLLGKYLNLAKQVQLVTVSNFAKQEFVKLGVPEGHVQVIYPGVKTLPFFPSLTKEGGGGDSFTIGILSRLDPEKGVSDFLDIILPHLLNHPDWKILIAGDGKDKEKIEKLTTGNPQIRLLGFVKNLDEFFPQISVLVYPTKVPESFGISALEAQSRGIPVIASFQGALPEIIEHRKSGFLVKTHNPQEWLGYLELTQRPDSYQQLRTNAISQAKKFSPQKMLRDFEQLFSNTYKPPA
jgi:glycosyltransferase involved in cell wall biosynthesis